MFRRGDVEEMAPGVHQVRALGAWVTVIAGDDGTVMVDAGGRGSAGRICRGLAHLGIRDEGVRTIVVTHSHPDHIGGLAEMVGLTRAQVAAHASEIPSISVRVASPYPSGLGALSALARPTLTFLVPRPVPVDHALADGSAVPGLPEAMVIHTPGHTPGTICILLKDRGVLLVGDALQYRFGRLGPPSALVTQDRALARLSMERLLDLDFEVMGFSHFPAIRQGAKEVLREMLRRRATP